MQRPTSLVAMTSAVSLLLAAPALAATAHEGKVVSAGDGKLTMTDMAGKNQHTHEVPADATILCGHEPCGLTDLMAGATVKVIMKQKSHQAVVTKIKEERAKMKAARKGWHRMRMNKL